MTKVSGARDKNIEQVNDYRIKAEALAKQEQEVLKTIDHSGSNSALKRLQLADSMLNLVSNYIVMDGVVQSVMKLKNENALDEARKALYKSIIYLEAVVSNLVDASYSEYEEKLSAIGTISPSQRYLLVRKMGLAIDLLKNGYGENTKWRWTFVEIEGRYAAVAKNIINLKEALLNSDFESEHYEPTVRHMALVKRLLLQAADRYRERYELSTNRIDDFKMGINFLAALRRLNIVTGSQEEAQNIKKKLDIWNHKLALDMEKHEKPGVKKG
ncbi:MAG: hypothetical protein LBI06_04655 [Treponema sp.]|jgi:hypothetical protein|nr:hypothetical protein [Treponema sp.]